MSEKSEENKAGETPAIDVAAITKSVTESVTKVFAERYDKALEDLNKNVGVLANTLKELPPAGMKTGVKAVDKVEGKKTGEGADATDGSAQLSADAVAKMIADAIAADRKATQDAQSKSAQREGIVAKAVKEKLGGDSKLGAFLTGDDEAAIIASADALAAQVRTYKADFGGAATNGGEVPGTKKAGESKGFLTMAGGQ